MRLRLLLPVLGLTLVGVMAYSWSAGTRRTEAPGAHGRDSVPAGALVTTERRAMVRFVNAMPGSPALELGQDSSMLFSNVVFGAVSPFKPVSPTRLRLTLRGPATTGYDVTHETTLGNDAQYSVIAAPDSAGRLAVLVVRDDLQPDSGKARVRLIRATATSEPVALAIVGQEMPLFPASIPAPVVDVRDMSPMTAGFRVQGGVTHRTLVSLRSMALVAGTTYTVVLTAGPRGAISAIMFSDLSPQRQAPAVVAAR